MITRLCNIPFSQLRKKTVIQVPKFCRPISNRAPPSPRVLKPLWRLPLSLCCIAFGYYYLTDTRSSIHRWFAVPALRWIYPDAEDAHHAGTKILKNLFSLGLHPRERSGFFSQDAIKSDISVTIFGQKLQNPIGTSAGIDKLAEIPDVLFALGPAVVEVGGATPAPQEGNPRPRVFRLPNHQSLINRYGLNSLGAEDMAKCLQDRLRKFASRNGYGTDSEAEKFVLNGHAEVPPGSLQEGKLLAIQIAKNKQTKDEDLEAVCKDYVFCVEKLAPYADILVVNVSSPNTPGLRTLQKVEPLTYILKRVVSTAKLTDRKTSPKVMVKVSPDEDTEEQVTGIVEAIWKSGVDGVIVGNTTKRRHSVMKPGTTLSMDEEKILNEPGGLSGPMMFERTLALVKRYRSLLDQGPPSLMIKQNSNDPDLSFEPKVIFASGGITNGKQALEILQAGASVAQIYTALVYGGLGTVTRIKREIIEEKKKM
ncbi:Dihydroorotate dehydrogenase, mitochondrial [Golovinomyces cichoracearum]|uniref:Dihydroorotate dehydrogenase (quinone), mitochondrial n=1 Tax=Golovinomyces cichoracearum TaxID=62708 RepID=A0A420JAS2_9PEZI|nr:Dihydroorotate dehydrogenase, mitochondrial [Golovinomyces cichoracearum]